MKKIFFPVAWVSILLIFNGFSVFSQESSGTLLWKISGNGLEKPSYLFGTMHLVCPDDLKLSEPLSRAIEETRQTYLELDMDDMGEMMGMMKHIQMKDGVKLKDLLSEDEYKKVSDFFTGSSMKLPIPFAMLQGYKPMLLASLIFQQSMECEATEGMEAIIMKKVKSAGKEIHGLETAEFQGSIFDSIPYKTQAEELVKSIDSLEQSKKLAEKMLTVYRDQDMEELEKLLLESDPTFTEHADLFLYNRNRTWAEKMPLIMKDNPTLFAVGAGHLVGEKGVVELLRKKGYRVEAL